MPEWLAPWITVAIVIWPLVYVEKWIHRHMQGVGLLVTNNEQAAMLIYYLIMLPGVALHEFSQFILAKLLRVKVKKFRLWPEEHKRGQIRLGLVEIDKKTDTVRATMVGMIPIVMGTLVIALIGTLLFDFEVLNAALASGDLPSISAGLREFMSVPDFWLWIYLIFSIANAMLPEDHDEINWWMLGGVVVAIFAFLWILDLSILIQAGLEGPVARLGQWLSLALVFSLVLDLLVMLVLSILEPILTRLLERELEYS